MTDKAKGRLIIIGGHEEKDQNRNREILKEVASSVKSEKDCLVVITVASSLPKKMAKDYHKTFSDLGVKNIEVLDIRTREEAYSDENVGKLANAAVIFFTGGDQLRITSQIGDSPVFRCTRERFIKGATVAGTSAGAASMPETMLISGPSDESNKISSLGMAPGLGFLPGVVIDSHFAERGRMGRLLGAVAQNPRNLGIGIDEDTAIVVENESGFRVIGSGAVYVVDGRGISYSSLSQRYAEGVVSLFDVKLHVLGAGDSFNFENRQPIVDEKIAKELLHKEDE
ncbi:MAG TPA: cyanophycinase [Chloroflexia bacterium]|nr:cyanophycinase [Chloroflexia bacterium]